jgi:hypothetical protein
MRARKNMSADTYTPLHIADQNDIEPKEATVPDRREGEADRRHPETVSAWRDPRLWLTFSGLLLTVGMALLGFIASMLISISAAVKTTNDLVLTETTRQAAEIKALEERVAKTEADIGSQTRAFNFHFTTRLARLEAAVGVKSQEKPNDEE